ncbi:arginine deiminase family protein [Streptomyces sp. NPDC001852]|uniref:arginine deiminase family protein n=1 Tax=Streptomyces sp. NPDC001852 TaxID=3364619 RepID=UPI00369E7CEF
MNVSRSQSWLQQACDRLCLGERIVVGYRLADSVLRRLRDVGVRVSAMDGAELVKGRGGTRCASCLVYRTAG